VCQWHNFLSVVVCSTGSNFPNAGNDNLIFVEGNQNYGLRPAGFCQKLQINCPPPRRFWTANPAEENKNEQAGEWNYES
jgi:hypothetical protein